MKFCDAHWQRLRELIVERGLGDLIAPSGETAFAQMADQLQKNDVTLVNFDPLMGAFWAVVANAMKAIVQGNQSAVGYLMSEGPLDEIDFASFPNGQVAQERLDSSRQNRHGCWPRCPLCYLNLAHELTCTEARCRLPTVDGYDWMLERAADEAKAMAERLTDQGADA